MKMYLKHNNDTIMLTEDEQSEIYEFYRFHSTLERINEVLDERNLKFKSHDSEITVTERVLSVKDDYHTSEDEAIDSVLNDTDYINNHIETT